MCFAIPHPLNARMSSKVDEICTLPDDVLSHILSFLPTKHAVATSVLSKRWTHLWRRVHAIDFSDITVKDPEASIRFSVFVHSVLLSRERLHPIKSFTLGIEYQYDSPHGYIDSLVTKWVNFVIQHRVEYLRLCVDAMFDLPKLPISILSCRTLVVLNLRWFRMKDFSSVRLPSLKILHLLSIVFEKLVDFLLLLGGCPLLEDLQAWCIFINSGDSLAVEIKSSSLSKLTTANINFCRCHFPLKALYNVKSLRIQAYEVNYGDIPTFHNLTHLELLRLNCNWHLLVEMLQHCPKLQSLDLDQNGADKITWIKEDDLENWEEPEIVPQCLSLHLRTCSLGNCLGLQGELMCAGYILNNARVLQIMKITSREPDRMEKKLSSCPKASSTCLLVVY